MNMSHNYNQTTALEVPQNTTQLQMIELSIGILVCLVSFALCMYILGFEVPFLETINAKASLVR